MYFDLTKEEKKAIAALHRLAKKWPSTLWLYSAAGTLNVMRYGEDGKTVETESGGFDQEQIVDHIDIPNDGGDW
jgi:hypothetical protein